MEDKVNTAPLILFPSQGLGHTHKTKVNKTIRIDYLGLTAISWLDLSSLARYLG